MMSYTLKCGKARTPSDGSQVGPLTGINVNQPAGLICAPFTAALGGHGIPRRARPGVEVTSNGPFMSVMGVVVSKHLLSTPQCNL